LIIANLKAYVESFLTFPAGHKVPVCRSFGIHLPPTDPIDKLTGSAGAIRLAAKTIIVIPSSVGTIKNKRRRIWVII
jgi:hypothetical protein